MDVTTDSFERDVIERSRELPSSSTSGPQGADRAACSAPLWRQRPPSAPGRLELAKLDVDANPELARRYQIQGIPAVKAFRDGEVVREFVGALPPAAVARFLDELTGPTAARRPLDELGASGQPSEVLS